MKQIHIDAFENFSGIPGEYKVVKILDSSRHSVILRHNVCGYEWKTRKDYFVRSNGCLRCFGQRRKRNFEEFLQELWEAVGTEYTYIDGYKDYSTYVTLKHRKCNKDVQFRPSDFFSSGIRCRYCHMEKMHDANRKTQQKFIEEVKNIMGDDYIVLGQYEQTNIPVKMKHLICSTEFMGVPHLMLSKGQRCFTCRNYTIRTAESFIKEVYGLVGDEYIVLGEFTRKIDKIPMKHNKCGHIWDVAPLCFLDIGTRCPMCYSPSNPENVIISLLKSNNINFKYQYIFDDCKNQRHLPFDFAVLDYDNSPVFLLEYDGQQHFYPVRFEGQSQEKAEVQYNKTKINDEIKNNYCETNNVALFRISYWEERNIKSILLQLLEDYKLLKEVA